MIGCHNWDIQIFCNDTAKHAHTELRMHMNQIQLHFPDFITGTEMIGCRQLIAVQPFQLESGKPQYIAFLFHRHCLVIGDDINVMSVFLQLPLQGYNAGNHTVDIRCIRIGKKPDSHESTSLMSFGFFRLPYFSSS